MIPAVANLPPLGPAPLRPRDPRFVHAPAELCQLAGVWKGKPLGSDWIVEEKVDGIRMLWIGDASGGGSIVTRKGEPLLCAEHLRPELERLQRRFGYPVVLDGEYQVDGGFLPTLAALRRAKRARPRKPKIDKDGHEIPESPPNGIFHWFDALPVEEWHQWPTGRACWPLSSRRSVMEVALGGWRPQGIVLAPQRRIVPSEDIERLAQWMWDKGGEGLMLKHGAAPYVRRRAPTWLKVKRKLRLEAVLLEVLNDGAAARVEYQGVKLRVAVPPPLRGNLTPHARQRVVVEAMEWTENGALRQGRIVETGKERT